MTNTTTISAARTRGPTPEPVPSAAVRSRRRWVIVGVCAVTALGLAVLVLFALSDNGGETDAQTTAVSGQGGEGEVLASDGARLIRRADGLFAELDVPVPGAGTYEYPTADMLQPWAAPHPPVSPGARDAPEVFTVWLVAFNDHSLCTEGRCDSDDVGVDVAARGGTYQLDGRIVDGNHLRFVGNIRLGQEPLFGAPLDDAQGAEIHIFIAPHGRALSGADGWRQLNGPVGNPAFWWSAQFASPAA